MAAQLDLIINAQKIQRDLVKTLGLTERAAASQALRIARDQENAAKKAADAQIREARRVADAQEREAAKAAKAAAAVQMREAKAAADFAERIAKDTAEVNAAALVREQQEAAAKVRQAWLKASPQDALRVSRKDLKATTSAMGDISEAASAAGKNSKAMGRGLASVAQQMPDVISQISAGTSVTQTLTQQGLQVAQVNIDLTMKAIKALGAALLSPVGIIAVGAATAAWSSYAVATADSKERSDRLESAIKGTMGALDPSVIAAAAAAWKRFNDQVSALEISLAVEKGQLSDLEAQTIAATAAIRESARARLLETATRWAALEVQRQELRDQVKAGKLSFQDEVRARARIDALKEELPAAKAKIGAIKEEIAVAVEQANALTNLKQAKERDAAASAAQEDAQRRATDASRDAAQEAERQRAAHEAAIQKQVAGLEALHAIEEGAAQSRLSERARILQAMDAEIERIQRIALEAGLGAEAEQAAALAVLEVENQARRQLAELEEQEDQAREAHHQAELARIEERRAAEIAAISATATAFGAFADLSSALSKGLTEEQQKAAQAAFAAWKASSLAQAIISSALAISKAAASAPPPLNIPGIAAAAATGAAQVATIATTEMPSFGDTPGIQQIRGGGLVQLAQDDFFVADQTLQGLKRQIEGSAGRQGAQIEQARIGGGAPMVVPMAVYNNSIQALGYSRQRLLETQLRRDIRTGVQWRSQG